MRKTILLTILVVLSGGVSAHPFTMDMIYEENTDHIKEEVNYYASDVPEFLGSLVGNQVINIRIEAENSTEELGLRIKGTRVEQIQLETYSDATMRVNTTESQIENITESTNPIKNMNRKLQGGEISYDSKGAINSIRIFVAKQLLEIKSLT